MEIHTNNKKNQIDQNLEEKNPTRISIIKLLDEMTDEEISEKLDQTLEEVKLVRSLNEFREKIRESREIEKAQEVRKIVKRRKALKLETFIRDICIIVCGKDYYQEGYEIGYKKGIEEKMYNPRYSARFYAPFYAQKYAIECLCRTIDFTHCMLKEFDNEKIKQALPLNDSQINLIRDYRQKAKEDIVFIETPNCFFCQDLKNRLISDNLEFTVRDMVEEPISFEDIKNLHNNSFNSLSIFFNTSSPKYAELELNDDKIKTMRDYEIYELLANNNDLIKTPIISSKFNTFVGENVLMMVNELRFPPKKSK